MVYRTGKATLTSLAIMRRIPAFKDHIFSQKSVLLLTKVYKRNRPLFLFVTGQMKTGRMFGKHLKGVIHTPACVLQVFSRVLPTSSMGSMERYYKKP